MAINAWRLVFRIVGWRLVLLLAASMVLYSMASAYIGGTLLDTMGFLREEPEPPRGYGLLSIYSGVASTPLTGVLRDSIVESVENVTGVVYAWGETTTPVLVNGTLTVLRGVPREAWNYTGLSLAQGDDILGCTDYTGVLVGAGLAGELGISPGDVILVDSLFSNAQMIYKVSGILEGPLPYTWEVITSPTVAAGLRGTPWPSVVRIVYDPSRIDIPELGKVLGYPSGFDRLLLHQAIVLLSSGALELRDPQRLEAYYIERMGVPSEYVFALGVVADALLASLTVPLAWLVVGFRRGSLSTLVEEGLPPLRVKAYLIVVTLPFILSGVIVGVYAAGLLPGVVILGYPVTYNPGVWFKAVHVLVFTGLYIVGLLRAGLEG